VKRDAGLNVKLRGTTYAVEGEAVDVDRSGRLFVLPTQYWDHSCLSDPKLLSLSEG
jgi:hypothetical protein